MLKQHASWRAYGSMVKASYLMYGKKDKTAFEQSANPIYPNGLMRALCVCVCVCVLHINEHAYDTKIIWRFSRVQTMPS